MPCQESWFWILIFTPMLLQLEILGQNCSQPIKHVVRRYPGGQILLILAILTLSIWEFQPNVTWPSHADSMMFELSKRQKLDGITHLAWLQKHCKNIRGQTLLSFHFLLFKKRKQQRQHEKWGQKSINLLEKAPFKSRPARFQNQIHNCPISHFLHWKLSPSIWSLCFPEKDFVRATAGKRRKYTSPQL